MAVQVKICGLTDKNSVNAAVDNGANYLGFVFFSASPRNITPEKAEKISSSVPTGVKKVALIVDETDDKIERILEEFTPDYFQLHGNEAPERLSEIKNKYNIPLIKAIPVRSSDDVAKSGNYLKVADMLLFDSKSSDDSLPGGKGLSFNWHLLQDREFTLPWLLAGGLNVNNIKEAVDITGAKIVDVSSSVEIMPGKKDINLIKCFLEAAKAI